MTSNQSGRKTRGKCRGDEPPEIRTASIAAFDVQDRLHRAYEVILHAAERAEQDGCTKATEMQGEVGDD